jgi:hypothetical protein
MGQMNTHDWRALIRKLRKHFPTDGKVVVCRRPTKLDCGVTTFNGNDYRIRVNSNQPKTGQVDTLLHEWAHVLAIDQAYRHEGPWGIIFAELYSAWVKKFEATP